MREATTGIYERMSWPKTLAVLAAAALASHLFLMPVGLALVTSEWAVFLTVADLFRQGEWNAFPIQQPYAGVTLCVARALFTGLWEKLFAAQDTAHLHVQAHMAFSYLVCPVLMAWCSYFLVRRYCSKRAALAVGLLAAVGFRFWVVNYGNDFYPFYFMLGSAFLAWRASLANPIAELTGPKALLSGVIAGHLYYTSPATAIFSAAFFLPSMNLLWPRLKKLRGTVVNLGLGFVTLGLYLHVFGRELGRLNGKFVKLDAGPNFEIGLALIAINFAIANHKHLSMKHLRNGVAIIAGFVIGMLPSVFFWWGKSHAEKAPLHTEAYDFETSMQALGLMPQSVRELFTNGDSVARFFSISLLLLGFLILFKKAKSEPRLHPIALSGVLSVALYCLVRTYVQPMAPARYLFPLFPAALVALGCAWDLLTAKNSNFAKLAVVVLFGGMLFEQLSGRVQLIQSLHESHQAEQIWETVDLFRKAGVNAVVSDDFLYGNTYTLASHYEVFFWTTGRRWGSLEAERVVTQSKRAGVFLAASGRAPELKRTEIHAEHFNQSWELKPLARIGNRDLYLGTRP